MDSVPRAFPLVYFHWFTGSTEKRKLGEWCLYFFVFYTLFPTDCVLGRGKGFREGASVLWTGAWQWFGPEEQFLKPGSVLKPTLKIYCLSSGCSTGCYSVFTSTPLSAENTQKINLSPVLFFVCLLLSKNLTKFQMDVLCFRNTRGAIKRFFLYMLSLLSNCSLWCGSVYTSSFSCTDKCLCLCLYCHCRKVTV